MYAHLRSVSASSDTVDEWLSYFRQSVIPLLKQQPGNLGLIALRQSGHCVTVTYWDDDHRGSSEWDRPADLEGSSITRQEAEVAFLKQVRLPTPGNTVDLLSFSLRPNQVYAATAHFEAALLPWLEANANFVGVSVMTEIGTGSFQVLLTWSGHGPGQLDLHTRVRTEIMRQTGTAPSSVGRYSLVDTLSLSEKTSPG